MSLVLEGLTPRSRSTDPTTSVDAGRIAQLSDSQQDVLALFAIADRPLADHELVALAEGLSPFSPQRLRSARAELAEIGRVVLVEGETRATERKRAARVWTVAE